MASFLVCVIIFFFLSFCCFPILCLAANNGLARTPPMGFSTWNHYHGDIDEKMMRSTADAMKKLGLLDVGYNRINIDGGWAANDIFSGATGCYSRDPVSHEIMVNKTKFPSGIEGLSAYIHSVGFLYGQYTSAVCSNGYEEIDAATFAKWGADMVKVDALTMSKDYNFTKSLVKRWAESLNATSRPILFSNCHCGCMAKSDVRRGGWHPWCAELTNMWRVSRDIQNCWTAVMHNLDTLVGIGSQAGPGAWNDADFLEVGNDFQVCADSAPLSDVEGRTHFSLWCVTSNPLIIGIDVRNMSAATLRTLTNREAIAVDQAWAGFAGDRVFRSGSKEVWAKPVKGTVKNPLEVAAVLFNRDDKLSQSIAVTGEMLGFSSEAHFDIYDLWNHGQRISSRVSNYDSPVLSTHNSQFLKFTLRN